MEADTRPTCLIDLDLDVDESRPPVVCKNKALLVQPSVLDELVDRTTDSHLPAWCHDGNFSGPTSTSSGHALHTHIVDGRWRLVQWTSAPERKHTALDDALADRDVAARKLQNLHKMMENVNVGTFKYDQRGKLVWANEAFYQLSSHPVNSEIEDTTWEDAVFDEDHTWLLREWKRMASGVPITIEMRWKRPASAMPDGKQDNEGRWVLATCHPTFDQEGKVSSVSGCLTDIAAQKRTQFDTAKLKVEALERFDASEKRFSNFAELASVGI